MHTSSRTTARAWAPGQVWIEPARPAALHLSGEIDAAAVSRFCSGVGARNLALAARLVADAGVRDVDLHAVTFADSSLVNLLCALDAATRPERLHVHGLPPAVALLLEVTGTHELIAPADQRVRTTPVTSSDHTTEKEMPCPTPR